MAIQIDPKTGERIEQPAIQIDPATGERIVAASSARPAGLPDGIDLPELAAHPAVDMRPSILGRDASPGTPIQKLFGDKPINSAVVVGQHLKNLVAGPYHAFTDAPRDSEEQRIKGTGADSGRTANVLGKFGLGTYRMLAQPTVENSKKAKSLYDVGDTSGAANAAMDAIPVAGSWARNISNDASKYGAIPALLGAGTDAVGPSAIGKVAAPIFKPLARTSAIGDVTRMIKPNATDSAFGHAPAEGLLQQPGGTKAWSKEALLDRSKAAANQIGTDIGKTIAAAPKIPSDVSSTILKPYESALQSAAKSNQTGLYGRLQESKTGLTNDLYHDPSTDTIQQAVGPKNLTAVNPLDLWNMKKQVGSNIRWTNQAFDDDLNATNGQVYSGLKQQLETAVPEIKPLSKKYGDTMAGIKALERRIPVEARNNAISLPDTIIAGAGLGSGGPAIGASTLMAKKALFSTPARTAAQTGLYNYGTSPVAPLNTGPMGLYGRVISQNRNQ